MAINLLTNCVDKLNADQRFFHHGRGANKGVWMTRPRGSEDGDGMIDLKKTKSGKSRGEVTIIFYDDGPEGVELKIEMYLPSYCERYTFFEGFVETDNDFDRVMVMLGIN